MASLLERMNVDPNGASRNKKTKNDRASPYNKRAPRGDPDGKWEHDMAPLESRLGNRIGNNSNKTAPKVNASSINAFLDHNNGRQTRSSGAISIKGASSSPQNVVDVKGLVAGTTADDVKAIFSTIGAITNAQLLGQRNDPVVRITYKDPSDAAEAIAKFNGQTADGKKLEVKLVGISSSDLSARIGGRPVVSGGSVDAFLQDAAGASKLRSDAILASDTRATVITTPAGQNPADYNPQSRGGRGRGRGGRGGGRNGGRGRGRKAEGGMDID